MCPTGLHLGGRSDVNRRAQLVYTTSPRSFQKGYGMGGMRVGRVWTMLALASAFVVPDTQGAL